MRAVVQRVNSARVTVEEHEPREIGPGLVILLGVRGEDTEEDARYLAEKIAHLRVFEDNEERFDRSLKDTGGSALVVSNFTLYGDCRKGRRPSFTEAAPAEKAEALYGRFVDLLRGQIERVETGRFQAKMTVTLENRGPVTLLLDSEKRI